jgi:hypothetical protein
VLLNECVDQSILDNSGSTAKTLVSNPFEEVKEVNEYFAKTFEPMGINLDLQEIKKSPDILEMSEQ